MLSINNCSKNNQTIVSVFNLQLTKNNTYCFLMSYLRYLCLFLYSGVQHILCCIFCFVCLRLVSVVPYLVSFSELSICIAPLTFIEIISYHEVFAYFWGYFMCVASFIIRVLGVVVVVIV